MQRGALNFERRDVSIFGRDFRAHRRQRIQHAPHRTAPQRGIAGNRGAKRLAGEHSGEQPHRRSGISGVESASRRTEPIQAAAGNPRTCRSFDSTFIPRRSRQSKVLRQSAALAKFEISLGALGERRQNRVAMRNGFIAGQFDDALDFLARMDFPLAHAEILARHSMPPASARDKTPAVAIWCGLGTRQR